MWLQLEHLWSSSGKEWAKTFSEAPAPWRLPASSKSMWACIIQGETPARCIPWKCQAENHLKLGKSFRKWVIGTAFFPSAVWCCGHLSWKKLLLQRIFYFSPHILFHWNSSVKSLIPVRIRSFSLEVSSSGSTTERSWPSLSLFVAGQERWTAGICNKTGLFIGYIGWGPEQLDLVSDIPAHGRRGNKMSFKAPPNPNLLWFCDYKDPSRRFYEHGTLV